MKSENLNANHFVLDLKAGAELRARTRQDPQAGLKQAAQQFEGMLLQMMLKSMRDATPQDGMLNSDQTRFFTSILDQQLAQNLSAQSGLGFAAQIEQQLSRVSGQGGADVASPLEALQQSLLLRQAANSSARFAGGGAERNYGIRSATTASAGSTESTSPEEYVNRVWPHAVEAANSIGVPPQFLIAQSALETGWGKSEIRRADGSPSYNLFGIKAGRNWQGETVEVTTTEYVNGEPQQMREKFRVYDSYAESFNDYASLIRNNARFSGVLGQQDGTQFARSLQQSGYATDPMYADKLGRIINGTTLRQALAG
ncbi:MAG: flagellar assembly peptidoglycan hydrolase FlgJ [Propionivibrio sp.]|jgi:flagellar protein FlgJ|uniref:flagellar assembly peptidoglycan hydrolase FlgJ n=1 Tax=Propionivibrio sp. TaxID=2212460 RepID=UPI001B723694|nr:flagellar assembly peptidoglycan hydrolase FlgJ [Propionivibrio sp.]MBP7203642.1 flagellar assembly peptidoglycan hydrolase FlgJ [Propionivibrio sp.]